MEFSEIIHGIPIWQSLRNITLSMDGIILEKLLFPGSFAVWSYRIIMIIMNQVNSKLKIAKAIK